MTHCDDSDGFIKLSVIVLAEKFGAVSCSREHPNTDTVPCPPPKKNVITRTLVRTTVYADPWANLCDRTSCNGLGR